MPRRLSAIRLSACALPFLLCACDSLDNWANANMPVIGQRCEHWQCFTDSGQQQSEINHQERLQQQAQQNGETITPTPVNAPPAPAAATAPPAPAAPAAAPPQAQDEPMPEGGAYKYVPRAPAAPGTTPYDGAYQPQ